ncbi:MFS transporter [Microvirga soli]|uniref:MFS transporter n=1 Tax=Microvirga soli TaxID=1854496 RepID=UPI00191CDB83|nr:MFS transporter [Microvirga soli]
MTSSLRTTLPTLFALLLGYALMQVGNTLQGTLLSVRGSIEQFTPTEIGAVGSAFWGGIVIGSLYAGRVIKQVGHTRAFSALAAVAASAVLLHLLVISPAVWIGARALTGFCFAGLFIVVESWLNASATPQTRGQVLSVYGMTGLIAGIGGQMLLPLGDPHSYRLFCFVAILISLALVPTALSRANAPVHAVSNTTINLMQLYRQSPFGVVAAVLCGITTSSFFALGPVWAQERGLDTLEVAIFMACGTLGGFATTYPLGWLSDRMDRRHVIIGTSAMAASILLVLIHFVPLDGPTWLVFAYVTIFGGSVIPTYSIVTAHVNDMVQPDEFVAAAGGLLILLGIGATIGPLIAGMTMTEFGRFGLLYLVIVTQSIMAIWGAYRSIQRAAPPTEAKESFVPEPTIPVGTRLEAH